MTISVAKRRSRASSTRTVAHDAVADNILRAIRRILRRTAEHSRQLSRDAGLTTPQLLCLRLIGNVKAGQLITAVDLAESVQLSTATVSRILDRLELLGFISRQRDRTDRRRVNLKLTRSGRARVSRLPIPLQEHFLGRLAALPKAQQRELLTNLETLVSMMGAEDLEVAPVLTGEVDVSLSRN
jgi:DNA-binding MarR family transcriptional regulator